MVNKEFYTGYEGEKYYLFKAIKDNSILKEIIIWEGYIEDIYSLQNFSKGITDLPEKIIDFSLEIKPFSINCEKEYLFLKNDLTLNYQECCPVIKTLQELYNEAIHLSERIEVSAEY